MILCALLFLSTSCTHRELSAHTQTVKPEDLASYHVGTPDPRLACPNIGQKLIVSWSLLESDMLNHPELQIIIRLRNQEECRMTIPITQPLATWVFPLLNDRFCETGGIKTYHLQIVSDHGILAVQHHQLWTELISFTPIVSQDLEFSACAGNIKTSD